MPYIFRIGTYLFRLELLGTNIKISHSSRNAAGVHLVELLLAVLVFAEAQLAASIIVAIRMNTIH